MLGSLMESMGMTGYAETPTPAATSAAYARALERATAATKAEIANFYPDKMQQKNRYARIHERIDELEFEDTRDQSGENIYERLTTRADRDGAPQFRPQKPYKLISGHTVHNVPVNRPLSPIQDVDEEGLETGTYSQDIEAKKLLESILRLDPEVTEAAAAVYHYIETNMVDDKLSPTGRAIEVIHSINDELRKGNSKPAYQFLATAKSVLPVLLEEREKAGRELEANIFSKDSEDSALSSQSESPTKETQDQYDDMRSISEQTAAIFKFLDDTMSLGTDKRLPEDPAGTRITHSTESNSNIFRILEEEDEVPSSTPDGIYGDISDSDDPSNFSLPNVDDMDLEFVENFDLAYSEFLFYHPKLVAKNSDLLKKIRIYKLQKLLEYNEILERTNLGKLLDKVEEKKKIEESMQLKLKDAARKKAAHQTFLQSEVNDVFWSTKQIQAKLRWKVFRYSEDRAKRQSKLREQFRQIPLAKSRQDLIKLIPEGPHSKKLETAIKASFIAEGSSKLDVLSLKQEAKLRKYQTENAVANSEIKMLNNRINNLRKEAEKWEWVQRTLLELDPASMHNFKMRVEEKEGVKL